VDAGPAARHKNDESGRLSTENGGQPVDTSSAADAAEPPDLVHETLAGARYMPGRGESRRARGRRIRRENLAGRGQPGYSGPGPDPARDPRPIGAVFADFVAEEDWQRPLAEGSLFADWSRLVGVDVAAHCRPESLNAGELRISAESTAWATQLRLLSSAVLARLVAELGPDVVKKLIITGPTGPSWKHGAWSVRGARGPRDTYG